MMNYVIGPVGPTFSPAISKQLKLLKNKALEIIPKYGRTESHLLREHLLTAVSSNIPKEMYNYRLNNGG